MSEQTAQRFRMGAHIRLTRAVGSFPPGKEGVVVDSTNAATTIIYTVNFKHDGDESLVKVDQESLELAPKPSVHQFRYS